MGSGTKTGNFQFSMEDLFSTTFSEVSCCSCCSLKTLRALALIYLRREVIPINVKLVAWIEIHSSGGDKMTGAHRAVDVIHTFGLTPAEARNFSCSPMRYGFAMLSTTEAQVIRLPTTENNLFTISKAPGGRKEISAAEVGCGKKSLEQFAADGLR